MRDILFRGKRIDNGEWAYGSIIALDDEWRYIIPAHFGASTMSKLQLMALNVEKVDPDTVGQYIGLTDKNGMKIFEGDVIRFLPLNYILADNKKLIGIVKFGEMDVPAGDPHEYAQCIGFYAHTGNYKHKQFGTDIEYDMESHEQIVIDMQNDIEIVGNIFDNPELVKEVLK